MSRLSIVLYETSAGESPFGDWLDSLDKPIRARIEAYIERFESGNPGNSKALKDGLCELKLSFGPGYRVYYSIIGSRLVLLITGGDKSSQTKDIATAKEYLNDYRRRYGTKK